MGNCFVQALFSETTRLAGLAKKLAEQIALASQHALLAALAASIISIVSQSPLS